eukprot:scaffold215218_cov32-Tisochrysis_lutea.AAC.1
MCHPQIRTVLLQELQIVKARALMLQLCLRILNTARPRGGIGVFRARRRVELVATDVHRWHWLLGAHAQPFRLENRMVCKIWLSQRQVS